MPNRGLKRCSGRKRSPQSAHARVDRAAYALPAQKRLPTRNTGTRQTKRAPHAERNYQRASRARGGRQNNSQPPYATRVARWARAPRALKHAPDSQIALGRAHRSQREAIIGRVGPCSERQATSAPVRHAKKRACMGSAFGQRLALSARRSVASRWARRYASPSIWSSAHPRPGRKPGQGLPTNKRPVAPRAAPRA